MQSIGGGSSNGVAGGTSSSSSGRPRRQKARKESKHYQVSCRAVIALSEIVANSLSIWEFRVGVGHIGIAVDLL